MLHKKWKPVLLKRRAKKYLVTISENAVLFESENGSINLGIYHDMGMIQTTVQTDPMRGGIKSKGGNKNVGHMQITNASFTKSFGQGVLAGGNVESNK